MIKFIHMKKFFKFVAEKANDLMDNDIATNGRSAKFRLTVVSLLAIAASFTIFNMIKTVL